MTSTAFSPGLAFESRPRREAPAPLRSDIAGFIGRTRRGPIGIPVRVEEWRGYLREFGSGMDDLSFPRAVHGYFENGGEVAWIVRAELPDTPTWSACWTTSLSGSTSSRTRHEAYDIRASSPGSWAEGLEVRIRYERNAPDGTPRVHFFIAAPDEPVEDVRDLDPAITPEQQRRGEGVTMESRIAAESRLIRLEPREKTLQLLAWPAPGPRIQEWSLKLHRTFAAAPMRTEEQLAKEFAQRRRAYMIGSDRLDDVPEVAILAVPGIYEDLLADDRKEVLTRLITGAHRHQDRMIIADAPPGEEAIRALAGRQRATADTAQRLRAEIEALQGSESSRAVAFANDVRANLDSAQARRCVAVYFPWLWVDGCARGPRRSIAPSGHIAGVVSRSDRQRGAHHTPANTPLLDAVDVTDTIAIDERDRLNDAGVNLLRCRAARGLTVWGGRTLDLSREGMFLGPRRLVHRLVRAIRRVAEPIVFDINGPELWLMLVRAISAVLLEVHRRGGLRGDRPEDAFRIRCDESLNPLSARTEGRVLCEIDLAPAAPMEFITIRIAIGQSGELEVFDK